MTTGVIWQQADFISGFMLFSYPLLLIDRLTLCETLSYLSDEVMEPSPCDDIYTQMRDRPV